MTPRGQFQPSNLGEDFGDRHQQERQRISNPCQTEWRIDHVYTLCGEDEEITLPEANSRLGKRKSLDKIIDKKGCLP